MIHGGQHREHADAVADEVRRVLGDHHALAKRGGEECLEAFHHAWVGEPGRDHFDQVHVARRVEEVHAAEAVTHFFRQCFGKAIDRQARGVRGNDGGRRQVRSDLLVEIELPVHPFGDGLDHQIHIFQVIQVFVVIGRNDRARDILVGQRRRRQFLQIGDGLQRDAALGTFLGGKVKQHGFDAGIGQVRSNLRAHDAGAENRRLADT